MKKLILSLAVAFTALAAQAEVKLPGWMTSHMVLQQQTNVHLSATAKKGAIVKITTSWDGQTRKVQADKQTGAFDFDLMVPKAGGPYTLTFDDGKKLVLEDVHRYWTGRMKVVVDESRRMDVTEKINMEIRHLLQISG